jgi:DNA-binding transcriptional MocR family regulator
MQAETDRVWRAVCEFFVKNGYVPTQRELAHALFMGGTGVSKAMAILHALGVIERDEAVRSLRIVQWHPEVERPAPREHAACAGCACGGGTCDLEALRAKLEAALVILDQALPRPEV